MDLIYLAVALFLVFLNAFFVATEFAVVKIRPTRIAELIAKRRPGAGAVRTMVANLDGYLAATQFGITLASLGLGWLGEPAFKSIIEGPVRALNLDQLVVLAYDGLATVLNSAFDAQLEALTPEQAALRRGARERGHTEQ